MTDEHTADACSHDWCLAHRPCSCAFAAIMPHRAAGCRYAKEGARSR
jgi:hypothetical protein